MGIRIHNSVNIRLDKPFPKTVKESLDTLKTNTVHTSLAGFRNSYITYVLTNWTRDRSGEGMMMLGRAREMQTLNNSYWSNLEVDLNTLVFPEESVYEIYTSVEKSPATIMRSNGGLRLIRGRLKFGGM